MCTLTYIPLKNEYIFTSNRDEHESRADTLFPVVEEREGMTIYFPQDPKAGGSWLACSNTQRIAILLNGAFEKHKHRPPYRKSRGIILLESFSYSSLYDFEKNYDLSNIEPFTLVEFDASNGGDILELRWDGKKTKMNALAADRPHIWSSAQLYSLEIRKGREEWFTDLLHEELDAEKVVHFHEFGQVMDIENNIKMDRGNGLRTISISQVIFYKEKTKFSYRNLVMDRHDHHWIEKV